MKRRFVQALSLAFIIIFVRFAAQASQSDAALKGFDQFITDMMKEWNVPGLAVAIVKDSQVVYSKGFGFRDVEKKLKVTPHTLFAIGSCSKAFTAVTMGILVDEGKLEWDKPVREYLPSFKLKDTFASERMTPRDLVCHRSGLPRHDGMWYNSSFSRKELFHRLQYLEPSKDFRTTYQYQNLMFMTAGYLIGEISGTTWEEFTKERILDPLGMNGSNFSVEDSKKSDDFALPYREKDDKIIEIPFRNIDTVGPAGSINSSVADMANWLLLNLNKGKVGDKQVVSEVNLKEIHSPQMISSNRLRYDELFYSLYGMGWGITAYRGHSMLSHGGGIDGFTARVSLLPKDKLGLVILTNMSGTPLPSIIAYNAYDRLLGLDPVDWHKRSKEQVEEAKKEQEKSKKEKGKEKKLGTKPSHPIEDYLGDYEHPGYGVASISKDGDQLKVVYNSIEYVMTHYHYDVFEIVNEMFGMTQKVSFISDVKGNIHQAAIEMEPAVDAVLFAKMPEKKMKEKSFLEKFVGVYVFESSNIEAKVFLKGENTLALSIPGQPEYELVPYKGTEFNIKNLKGYSVEFVLDEKGVAIEAKSKQPNGIFTAKKK